MRDSKMVGAGTDQESIVDCGTFDPMGGGIFQFGLVLVASSTAVIERLWSKFDFISPDTGEQPKTVSAGVNLDNPGSKSNERLLCKKSQRHRCFL